MRKISLVSLLSGFVLSAALLLPQASGAATKLAIYPAPAGEPLSSAYKVQVDGRDVPAYQLKVAPEDKTLRLNAVENSSKNGVNFEDAAFASFDADGSVEVTVTYSAAVTAARLLPASPAIPVKIQGKVMRFTVNGPQNLTLEVNHQVVRTLHIFINPIETDAPLKEDAKVLYFAPGSHELTNLKVPPGKTIFYFGPGVHTVDNLVVHDGQTVYIAGGAIVRSVTRESAHTISGAAYDGQAVKLYTQPAIQLVGAHISFRGRGILDGSSTLGKSLLTILGQDISLEGVILQNSGAWFMPIRYSDRVLVTNLKILGYRATADGIDIYSSRDVTVQGCFVRTTDDLIVIKSGIRTGTVATDSDTVKNVMVRGNRLWNETGVALNVGTEVGADISAVTFIDNDVIHDLSLNPTQGVWLSGSGKVSNIRFEGNRIDRTGNFYDHDGASSVIYAKIRRYKIDETRPLGKIWGVVFSNIQVTTSPQNPKVRIQLQGASDQSDIENVKFENITVNGNPLSKSNTVVEKIYANGISGLP